MSGYKWRGLSTKPTRLPSISGLSRGVAIALVLVLTPVLAREPIPVVLRVNDFDVLFPPPHAPYLDSTGRVMITLSGFAQLMPMTWAELAEETGWRRYQHPVPSYHGGGSASLRLGTTTLYFVPGRAEIRIVGQGQAVLLPFPPKVLPGGEPVVPLNSLAQALGFSLAWDPVRKLAWIRDPRFLVSEAGVMSEYAPSPKTEDLFPVAYRFFRPSGASKDLWLEVWVKDRSQNGIPEDKEGIFLVAGESYRGRQHIAYPSPGPLPPCRRTGDGFYCLDSGDDFRLALMTAWP